MYVIAPLPLAVIIAGDAFAAGLAGWGTYIAVRAWRRGEYVGLGVILLLIGGLMFFWCSFAHIGVP